MHTEAITIPVVPSFEQLSHTGCGCASADECRLNTTNWAALPKEEEDRLWNQTFSACARLRRRTFEQEAERLHQKQERKAERERQWADARARSAAVTIPIAPSPLLLQLRETVLAHREDRLPKWYFTLEPELVVMIQPRAGTRPMFICIAIAGTGITKGHFTSRSRRYGRHFVEFGLVADPDTGGWRSGSASPATTARRRSWLGWPSGCRRSTRSIRGKCSDRAA